MAQFTEDELLRIRDMHHSWLRAQPGVVGTGVGFNSAGQVSLKIYSDHMPPDIKNAILQRLEGISVEIEETGRPRLLNE